MKELDATITFKIEPAKHFPPARRGAGAHQQEYAVKCIEEMLHRCCDFPLKVRVSVTNSKREGYVKTIQL